MKALRLYEPSGPESLRIDEVQTPVAGPGEVLIRVRRAALNRRDVFISQGQYPGLTFPLTLGSDGAGEIAEVGTGVIGHAPGDLVVIYPELGWHDESLVKHDILGMPRAGTFAEYVTVPVRNVYAKPRSLSYDEAAAIPLAGLTAYRAVFTRGQVRKDDIVLIPGVGSGVQTFALLFAVHAGAKTIVTSGSDEKLARATSLGAYAAINYNTNPDWHNTVLELTGGKGPTLVIDSVGGPTLTRCIECAAIEARVVIYGATKGAAAIQPPSIFWKHLDVRGTSTGSPSDFAAMLRLFENGLRPAIDCVYPLEDIGTAARRLSDGAQFGKILLSVN